MDPTLDQPADAVAQHDDNAADSHGLEIALVGMSGRFPGADSVDAFWRNLLDARESITELSEDQLRAHGASEAMLADPAWKRVGAPLDGADLFDAGFFGYSPREAEILDPQQRLFLECAWHALEDAGYDAQRYAGAIGVFGGAGMNGYLLNLYSNPRTRDTVSPYELFISNDKDFLTTRVSYKLGLQGPSVDVQTACSSSLVAVHLACQSLLGGECDMALAGGVAVSKQVGYRVQEGGIYSPDGHCRAFDAQAAGTVGGNGVGLVVLKRLADAIADGDSIIAVIKGSAINNDGAAKVSYTAPSVDAQSAVIRAAFDMAGVTPDSIGYVEAHGTGTRLGDPIEIAALTRAFDAAGASPVARGRCALGSVKTNIGHLDAAAGIASLIKTAMAVRAGTIPPSLHFSTPNPQIDFAASPFRVNATLSPWRDATRRAGVSSFGIGGTNAHVVLEQAPAVRTAPRTDGLHLLPLSARSEASLAHAIERLARKLEQAPGLPLADVAWTLQQGRRSFEHRCHVLARDTAGALAALRDAQQSAPARAAERPSVVWLFTGQGSQYAGMARALYAAEPVFRDALDRCAALLDAELGRSLVALLCGDGAADALNETVHTQPALFAFEYALARLWQSRGVRPQAMLGHSLGEYVAACLAGVFTLDDALRIVSLRARRMQDMTRGAMLAVMADAQALQSWLDADTALAAINAPGSCVLSGPADTIARLESRAHAEGIACQRLRTSHAFHSPSMRGAADDLIVALRDLSLQPPRIPFISNLSGDWISDAQATDPAYWARHLLDTVRFGDGLRTALALPDPVFLEIGAGTVLSGLLKQNAPAARVVHSLPGSVDDTHARQLLSAAGRLWSWGVDIDWRTLHAAPGRRVSLPGYAFERQRYWVDAGTPAAITAAVEAATTAPDNTAHAFAPAWQRRPLVNALPPVATQQTWLLLPDAGGVARALAAQIERAGFNVFTAVAGDAFAQSDYREFRVNPASVGDLRELRAALEARDMPAGHIVDLRALDGDRDAATGFDQLRTLALAWSESAEPAQIAVLTRSACDVLGDETLDCEQAVLQGLCQVIGQEYPILGCRQVDLAADAAPAFAATLWNELRADDAPPLVAWRGRQRWQMEFEALALAELPARLPRTLHGVKRDATHLVIGDLARGLGALQARGVARAGGRLVLVSAALPVAPVDEALVAECRALGAEVSTLQVAPDDDAAVQAAFDEAARDGLAGVFVSLPTTHEQSAAPLALLGPEHWHYNQRSRVGLLRSTAIAVARLAPAWCCVQSSMSSVLGGIGLAPYAAANHFVDAFVAQQTRDSRCAWFAINWDATKEDGATADASAVQRAASLQDYAIDAEQVWALTTRVLALAAPGQIAVSRGDLSARRRHWLHTRGHAQAETPAGAAAYARPALSTDYVAPRSDIERTIAELWQDLLRLDRVGIHDSFFDLGGHSLLAIQAIGRLRQAFPVQLELRELLDGTPTVAGIAAIVAAQMPDADQMDRMAALLAEVEAMSSEDVAAELTPLNKA